MMHVLTNLKPIILPMFNKSHTGATQFALQFHNSTPKNDGIWWKALPWAGGIFSS